MGNLLKRWQEKYKTNKRRINSILLKQLNCFRQRPLMADIELTYRCNLRCQMCTIWERGLGAEVASELSYAEYCTIFKDLKELGVSLVTLGGGEPLLRGDIDRIINELNRLNIRTYIFTNATALDEKMALALIKNRVNKVIVSVDGFGDTHDLVRGVGGCFDRTISGVNKLIKVKKGQKACLPDIDFHTVISNLNFADLEKLHKLCKDLGVNFSFQPVSESDNSLVKGSVLDELQVGSPRYLPQQDSLRLKEKDVLAFRKQLKNIDSNLYTRVMNCISDGDLACARLPVKKCFVVRDIIFIDPYGNVYPCTNLDQYFLGNVRNQSVKEIWNNDKHRLLKNELKKKLFPVCSSCCHLAHNLTFNQMLRILFKRKL